MENQEIDNIGGFKKFVKTAGRIVDKISVTTGGVVGFSTSFSNEHKLNTFKAVVLYWNAASREIGIEFTSVDSELTPKLRANKNGYGYTVNAKAFFAVNHIDTHKHHGRYPYKVIPFNQIDPSYIGSGNMYVFSVQPQPAVTPPPVVITPPTQPAAPAPETVQQSQPASADPLTTSTIVNTNIPPTVV
jgi:hypothetical protein